MEVGEEGDYYDIPITVTTRTTDDSCIKMGSDKSRLMFH